MIRHASILAAILADIRKRRPDLEHRLVAFKIPTMHGTSSEWIDAVPDGGEMTRNAYDDGVAIAMQAPFAGYPCWFVFPLKNHENRTELQKFSPRRERWALVANRRRRVTA